ncbi:glycerol-3-phosphate dehydrogenase [NAD(+)], cytoplasmic isoform X2 [Callorhinchus milii]|nr:glycerol-3-phosphate dehydrogenase [NAD(+)], cytoplasmic isoform X2 [Callorhinchus milii]
MAAGKAGAGEQQFESQVRMWAFEEMVDGRRLSEIINQEHENIRYLPGHSLPHNLVVFPDLLEASRGADILIFAVPQPFIGEICNRLKGHVKPGAIGVSLIKGFGRGPEGLKLLSDVIGEELGIEVSVLTGANLAQEVAAGTFCESTLGCRNQDHANIVKSLLQTSHFHVSVVSDLCAVQLCGALKHVVALGAGLCDGLRLGGNTKAAAVRLGLMEIIGFVRIFSPSSPADTGTFFHSCGVADLIASCYAGRNRRLAEAFVVSGQSVAELEKELMNGQKVEGPNTASELNHYLKSKHLVDQFPLFTAVHQILFEGKPVSDFISYLQKHPEHM